MKKPRTLLAVVLVLLTVCSHAASGTDSKSKVGVVNDDYCDSSDGFDETGTSACSHLPVHFNCTISNVWSVSSIPTSRVNDGVCDCCDGSDEISPLHKPCANTCEVQLLAEKQKALAMHRNIQAGMRARTELVEGYKLAKSKEVKLLENMKAEITALDRTLFRMMFFLQKEEPRETSMRFTLLREREDRCARGDVEACDFFRPGYFELDELVHEGYPLEYANKQKRFHWQYAEGEREHLQRLSGLERVKLTICTTKDLLPDENARIFTQLGEYLGFADSPGGKISRESTPRRRKQNPLFGPFLENDRKGYLHGQLFLLEITGLILSPVTMMMRALGYVAGQTAQFAWYRVERCAYPNAVLTGTALLESPAVKAELQNIGVDFPSSAAAMCKLILQYDVEGSVVANALSVVDYTSYSVIMTMLDVWGGYLSTPSYMWEVIYRAPVLYWDYYVTNKTAQLPPQRNSCLLRTAIDAAHEEIRRLRERIDTQETLIRETAAKRLASPPSEDTDQDGGRRSKRGRRGRAAAAKNKVALDFGVEGTWESVLNSCLESAVGGHEYQFCFFGEVRQDDVRSLGHFSHWGSAPETSATMVPSMAAMEVSVDGSGALQTMPGEEDGDILDSDFESEDNRAQAESREPTARILSDLSRHPYIGPVVSALQSAAGYVTARMNDVGEYVSKRNRIVGATADTDKLIANIHDVLHKTHAVLAGEEGSLKALGGDLFSAAQEAQVWFKGTPEEVQAHYSRQVYAGGTRCNPGHGAPRRTEVLLECGMASAITEVVETQMCEYRMTISTPLVCTKQLEAASLRRLDELGVFGFSKNSANSGSGSGAGEKPDAKAGSATGKKGAAGTGKSQPQPRRRRAAN